MKNYFLLAFLFATNLFLAQSNDKKIFLDSLWKETSEGNHKYYRIIKDYYTEQESYKVYDYYATDVLQMEGTYKDKELAFKKGNFIYYYDNGNKKTEGVVENERSIGSFLEWYENGVKKAEGEYIKNEKAFQNDFKILNYWDDTNKQLVINGNGYVVDVTKDYSIEGTLKNGLREGIWTGSNKKTKISFTENYKNGDFISGISTDSDNIKHSYNVVEERPEPKNGLSHFMKFISKKMKLPKLNHSLKGRVVLEFIVEKNGEISDIKVIKSLTPELDKAAIEVLDKYKNWIPGKARGLNVRVRYSLPIMIDIRVE